MAAGSVSLERVLSAPFKAAGRFVGRRMSSEGFEDGIESLLDKLTFKNFAFAMCLVMLALTTASFIACPDVVWAIEKADLEASKEFEKIAELSDEEEDPFNLDNVFSGIASTLERNNPINVLLKPLATLVNFAILLPKLFLALLFGASPLMSPFESISKPLFDVIQNVHRAVVIPLGNSVALIVFAVGLVKVFANSSSTEAGIDLWKIMLIFISFGATLIVINASWEIMVALFDLARHAIMAIGNDALNMPASESSGLSASTNLGTTMFAGLVALIGAVALVYAVIVCNVMVIARGIEIYMYACYSPVAFAFLVTEGGRQMTEAFLKRYAAVLLAGAIQLLLLILLGASIPRMGTTSVWGGDGYSVLTWAVNYINSYVIVFVVAYMMKRSTTLAKDIIGTN